MGCNAVATHGRRGETAMHNGRGATVSTAGGAQRNAQQGALATHSGGAQHHAHTDSRGAQRHALQRDRCLRYVAPMRANLLQYFTQVQWPVVRAHQPLFYWRPVDKDPSQFTLMNKMKRPHPPMVCVVIDLSGTLNSLVIPSCLSASHSLRPSSVGI